MNGFLLDQPSKREPIHIDELGIHIAIVGKFRLKTAFQLIYGRGELHLIPSILRARCDVFLEGRRVSASAIPMASRAAGFDQIGAMLAAANYGNADIDGLDLYVERSADVLETAEATTADVNRFAAAARGADLVPPRLICEIDVASENALALHAQANVLRRQGALIALAHFNESNPLGKWMDELKPDLVRIDGAWFNRICGHQASRKLLGALVRSIHDRGARVLLEGLDTAEALHAALEAEADYLEGASLQPSGLVGTLIDGDPIPIADLRLPSNVIPLQRLRRRPNR